MISVGRPRSVQADRAIVDAVLEEVIAVGIDGLSIEQVAARAGVAKATVYRRWPNKEALLLDAVTSVEVELPTLPGTSVRDDLVLLVDSMRRRIADAAQPGESTASRLYPCMIAEGARHPEIAAKYKQIVVEQRREAVREVLRRGVANGELRSDLDVETMLLLVIAPMLVQLYMWSAGVELPANSSAIYVDAVLDGLRLRPALPVG
ncbi:MAG TPA: TetR/AcrR family transcriptional regulator [Acidothermaceae bacterium]|jgi:AcrR family transcriptional regulator